MLTRSGITRRLDRDSKVQFPDDPFLAAKLDYIFNLARTGVLTEASFRFLRSPLVVKAAGRAGKRVGKKARRLDPAQLARSLTAIARRARKARTPAAPALPTGSNLALFAQTIGLSDIERHVLSFALCCRDDDMQEVLHDVRVRNPGAVPVLVAAATGIPAGSVEEALQPTGRLLTTGMLRILDDGSLDDRLVTDRRLGPLLAANDLDATRIVDRFLPAAPPPTLATGDFEHLAPELELARTLLGAALTERRRGVNILLYGPTGTGKSELARLLASSLESSMLVAGREDEKGASPSADERLTSLLMGNRLVSGGRGLLLFDEMEDLFVSNPFASMFGGGQGRDSARMSKQWFNQLLETNAVPTIWISNSVRRVDPAFLRRFAYVVELPDFTAGQRRRAWVRHLGGEDVLPRNDVEALAQRFEVNPAQIGGAVAASRLITGGKPDRASLEAVLEPAVKLSTGARSQRPAFEPTRYLPEVVNTPVDLDALATQLAALGPGAKSGTSLCLHGPPGTGKSEYVRYLAHRIGRPLLARRVSDIASKWVGDTEKNIARAFEQARRDGALLLFDEADSFLRDRRGAQRSWEVTQVNEFLQQMEEFTGVVACTTNLFKDLDQASLRRFTFKIPFDFLKPQQARQLFRATLRELGSAEVPDSDVEAQLARLTALTPGDFAAVRKRFVTLATTPTAAAVLDELRREVDVKEAPPRRVGF